MRDLRQAMKEGPRATLASASHLPYRHPGAFAGGLFGLAVFGLLTWVLFDTRRDVDVIQPQVAEITKSDAACQRNASPAQTKSCVRRIQVALERCRQSPPCRAEFLAVLQAARLKGGDAQTSPPARQRPGPRSGGRRTAPRRTKPKPAPQAVAPAPAPAPPSPGNSANTPASEKSQGVQACVDLAVSACVKADLP